MAPTCSVETRITNACSKIAKGLADYFQKNVDNSCGKIRAADEIWMDATFNKVALDFQQKCAEQVKNVLERFSVAERCEQLAHHNQHMQVSKPWLPSGDPEIDIRAHLLPTDLEYLENLTQSVLNLNRELRLMLNELRNKRRHVQDEYAQLQLLVRQVEQLHKSAQFIDQYCSIRERLSSSSDDLKETKNEHVMHR